MIGESRAADILANVLFPFWAAHELKAPASPSAQLWTEYAKLPAQLSNRRLETAATRLFGNDPRRKEFLRTVAHQQGLLQIYEDFCMQDNSDCAQCPFPEQMAKWIDRLKGEWRAEALAVTGIVILRPKRRHLELSSFGSAKIAAREVSLRSTSALVNPSTL